MPSLLVWVLLPECWHSHTHPRRMYEWQILPNRVGDASVMQWYCGLLLPGQPWFYYLSCRVLLPCGCHCANSMPSLFLDCRSRPNLVGRMHPLTNCVLDLLGE